MTVNRLFKKLASPVFDPVGDRLLGPPICGLWGVRLNGDRRVRRIALTFDDGPVAGGTERILDTLGEFKVPGTFFFLGVNALQHPELVTRAAREGHVVGNHSMRHSRIGGFSLRSRCHFLDSENVLGDVLGWTPRLYRSPWGWSAPWEVRRLREHGLEPIGWDVYPSDDHIPTPSGECIAERVFRAIRPGSILLFHDGYTHACRHEVPETVTALRIVIPALRSRGYGLVSVPDLLGLEPYKSEARGL